MLPGRTPPRSTTPPRSPRPHLRARLGVLLFVALAGAFGPGCVFCSFLEYSNECCGVCGTLCSQTCLPICVDTALGRGPLNKASVAEADPALPALKSQPTPVAY